MMLIDLYRGKQMPEDYSSENNDLLQLEGI